MNLNMKLTDMLATSITLFNLECKYILKEMHFTNFRDFFHTIMSIWVYVMYCKLLKQSNLIKL